MGDATDPEVLKRLENVSKQNLKDAPQEVHDEANKKLTEIVADHNALYFGLLTDGAYRLGLQKTRSKSIEAKNIQTEQAKKMSLR